MIRVSRFLRVTLASMLIVTAWAEDHKINEKTARKLVELALVVLGRSIPPSQVQPMTSYWAPEFYSFEAVLGQSNGLPALRYYFAVNPWNGEVWNTSEC